MADFYKNEHNDNALNFNLEFTQITRATARRRVLHIQSTCQHPPCALLPSGAVPARALSLCPLVDLCMSPIANLPHYPPCDTPCVLHALDRTLRRSWQPDKLSHPCAPLWGEERTGAFFSFSPQ
jgi:hypothetical protein